MNINEKYFVRTTSQETKPGCWNYLLCEIFKKEEDGTETKIGEYTRNYSSFYHTFFPFMKNGKEYAFYSKSYTTTSVMSLPDCKHLCDDDKGVFCPTSYYAPDFEDYDISEWHSKQLEEAKEKNDERGIKYWKSVIEDQEEQMQFVGKYALVAGCVWGDDSGGWKVHLLDISNIENGELMLLNTMGYFELPMNIQKLSDVVYWDEPRDIEIGVRSTFKLNKDLDKSGFFGWNYSTLNMYSGDDYKNYRYKVVKIDPNEEQKEEVKEEPKLEVKKKSFWQKIGLVS